jgi:hypothetical protein
VWQGVFREGRSGWIELERQMRNERVNPAIFSLQRAEGGGETNRK